MKIPNGEIGFCECINHSECINEIIPTPFNIRASRSLSTVYPYYGRKYCIFCIERNEYYGMKLIEELERMTLTAP